VRQSTACGGVGHWEVFSNIVQGAIPVTTVFRDHLNAYVVRGYAVNLTIRSDWALMPSGLQYRHVNSFHVRLQNSPTEAKGMTVS
jgi:hypothetical protein